MTCTTQSKQVQFKVETFDEWLADAKWLFPLHWEELTLDKDIFDLPWPAEEQFRQMERQGKLVIVTARAGEKLVGYWIGAILPHLHYKDAGEVAYTDMYFVHPDYRGPAGVQLFATVEDELRRRGAVKFYISCKVHRDHSKLFAALKFRKSDFMFTKRLV